MKVKSHVLSVSLKLVLLAIAACVFAIGLSACSFVRDLFDNEEESKFRIDFYVDGEIYSTIYSEGEEKISMPDNPSKEDYIFDGWYLDEEIWEQQFVSDYLLDEKLTENISVYAKWEKKIFEFGTINYNRNKKAVSIYDDVTADLFDAKCTDANGNIINLTAAVIGEYKAGETISVQLTAQAKGYNTKSIKINDIKVYGDPVIEISDENRDYVVLSDKIGEWNEAVELQGSLFGVSCKDSFGNDTEMHLTVDGAYEAGEMVTLVIYAIDSANNVVTRKIENVAVYGEPKIEYNQEKLFIKQTDEITPQHFEAVAYDSFGTPLEVIVERINGFQIGGRTITVKLSATDSKGNTGELNIGDIKVYSIPTLSGTPEVSLRTEDTINAKNLGLVAYDSFGESLNIELCLMEGDHVEGSIVKYLATVMDVAGNTNSLEIAVKIYGKPVITVGKTIIKEDEPVTIETLQVEVVDSFGQSLETNISLKTGIFAGGNIVTYCITAVDMVGNTTVKDNVEVRVYSADGITFYYLPENPQAIKLTSCGEELISKVVDSFGEPCEISLEAVEGYTITGGRKVSLYVNAMDIAGNTKRSEIFTDIKIYDLPTLHLNNEVQGYAVSTVEELNNLFVVKDSFGESLSYNVELIDQFIAGQYVNVVITACDAAGNNFSTNQRVVVVKASEKCTVSLFLGDKLIDTIIVDDPDSYILPVCTDYGTFKGWYDKSGKAYTNSNGEGTRSLNIDTITSLYLYTDSTIYSVSALRGISLTGNYILMRDLDLNGMEWSSIGTSTSPFRGKFDGNGHIISNFTNPIDKTGAGLFGYISNATIINLHIENCEIVASYGVTAGIGTTVYGGGLVGYNDFGTIENCSVTGSVSANSTGKDGVVHANTFAGGLVGFNTGIITNCYANCKINANGLKSVRAGGLVGQNEGTIINCYAIGDVTANAYDNDSIYNGNTVPNTAACAGGLVGVNYQTDDTGAGQIIACYATGYVESRSSAYGGSFGSSGSSYATAISSAGGLVGWNFGDATIVKNSFAVGDVNCSASASYSATVYSGAIVGRLSSEVVSNCVHFIDQNISYSARGSTYSNERYGYSGFLNIDANDLQSEMFLIGTLKWSNDDWIFSTGEYPALRGCIDNKVNI